MTFWAHSAGEMDFSFPDNPYLSRCNWFSPGSFQAVAGALTAVLSVCQQIHSQWYIILPDKAVKEICH